MAENGHPAESSSGPFPPDAAGSVSSERPADGAIFPLSKSSGDVVATPSHPDDLRKSSSSPSCSRTSPDKSAETPTTDDRWGGSLVESSPLDTAGNQPSPCGAHRMPETLDHAGGRLGEPCGPQARQNQAGLRTSLSTGPRVPETLPPRPRAERPHSIAEIAPSHHALSQTKVEVHSQLHAVEGGAAASRGSSSSLRDEPPQQQVHRSLSASLHPSREPPGPHPRRSETSAPCPGAGYCGRGVPCCPMLVCKQPMQLLQSNTMTTCRSSGSSSPTQQLGAGGGVRICVPSPTHGEAVPEEPCFLSHGGLEDTFAAYCHPLPIPAPAQLLPCPPGAEGPPHSALLAFPRLISSVSETGLDAKRMMGCCGGVECQEPGRAYPPPPQLTRDTGTMTSHGELRDVGVQTGHHESPPPHVFPEVSLAGDEGGGSDEGPNGAVGGQKSPIKEVLWDAEGMTWEVYGASVDPEELGLAIQKHLELQIKEKAGRVAQLTRQDTITSQQSRRRRKRGFMMGSLRNPACCARSSTVVD